MGFGPDVGVATALNTSSVVPLLVQGVFVAAAAVRYEIN